MSKEQELGNIFNQAQKTLAAHARCIQALEKHYTKNPATFATNFINMVKRLLLIFKRDAHIERAVQLVITFACKPEIKFKDESFGIYLLKFLLDLCDMGKPTKQAEIAKAIRFRSCQIIAGILNNMPDDAPPIDEELWQKLSKVMVERTMDKIPVVRVQAIAALHRLQEPYDPTEPILSQYLRLMNTDTNKDVRKAVLTYIAVSKATIPDILKRTRDVLPDVRKHAFSTISRLEIKGLTIAQRNTLIKNGLSDRDSTVRESCLKTCEEWLQSRGNIIEFLKCLDVEDYEENAILLLKQLLPRVKVEKEHLSLDAERITPELAILFRMHCDTLKQDKKDDLLEDTVPELMQYCELVAGHRDDNFVLKQLLQISSYLNLQNEAGRKSLSSLLRHLLLSRFVDNTLIEKMMIVLREIHPLEDDYNRIVLETISEVREPLESLEDPETQQALKELDEYMEGLDAEIAEKKQLLKKTKQRDVIEALTAELAAKEEELKQIEERENMRLGVEEWAWLRCLTLTQNLLRYTTKSLKDGGIAELKEAVFAGGIQHENPEVREAAMGCLGVYCLLDKTIAFKHVLLLRHALDNDDISVRCAALKTLCDIILVFGSTFKVEVEGKIEDYTEALGTDPTVYLAKYLRSEESSLRDIAAQGLSRIFITKGASSKFVMKELILAFFVHGDSSSGSILQQCLSVFFPTFAFGSEKNQLLVASIAIDIFRDVAYAAKTSPLHKVQLQTLLQFLVHLTDHNNLVKKPVKPNAVEEPEAERKYATAHNYMAEGLLMEFMTNPTGKEAKFLAKILASLSLDKSDQEFVHRMRALADVASSDIADSKDKVVIKAVSTFEDVLKSLDVSDEIPSEDLKTEMREKVEDYNTEKAQWLGHVADEEARARKAVAKAAKKAPVKSVKGGKKKKEESDEEVDSEISSVSSVEDESIELESDDESQVDESEESDVESEDDEELPKPKSKNNKTIKDEDAPPRTRKIVSDVSDSDLELSEDEDEKEPSKPVKAQPRLSNASVKSAKQKVEEAEESDDEPDSLLLSDDEEKNERREAQQIEINTPKSKAKTSKRIIDDSDEEDEVSDVEEEQVSSVKKSPLRRKPAAAAKKSRAVVSDSEDDEDLSLSLSDDEADDEFEEEDEDISDISEIEEDSDVEETPIKKKAPAKKTAPAKNKRAIVSDDEAEEESAQVTPAKSVVEEEDDKENDKSAANTPVQSPVEAKPAPKPAVQPAAAKATTAGKVQRTSTGATATSARPSTTTKPVTGSRPSVVPAPRPSIASSTTSGIKKPTTTMSRPSIATAAPRPSIASSTAAKPTPRLSVVGTAAPAKTSTAASRPSITPATRPSIASSRPSLASAKPTTAVGPKPSTKPAVGTKPSISAARPSVVSKELRSEIDRVLERDSPDTKKENQVNKKPNVASSAVASKPGVKKPAVATKPAATRPSISYRGPVEQTPMVKGKPNPALLNTTTKNLRADIDSLLD